MLLVFIQPHYTYTVVILMIKAPQTRSFMDKPSCCAVTDRVVTGCGIENRQLIALLECLSGGRGNCSQPTDYSPGLHAYKIVWFKLTAQVFMYNSKCESPPQQSVIVVNYSGHKYYQTQHMKFL